MDLVDFANASTDPALVAHNKISLDELQLRTEFCANYLIVLKEQGRVGSASLPSYNEVIKRYIKQLECAMLKSQYSAEIVDMLSFYIATGLVGASEQYGCFASIALGISDEKLQDLLIESNARYWREEPLDHLYVSMVVQGMYGEPAQRLAYHSEICRASVFKLELSSADQKTTDEDAYAIGSFKWLYRRKDISLVAFTRALALFNE